MWPFRPKAPPPPPDPAERDYTGEDIWQIVSAGLLAHGLRMRRDGTASMGWEKFNDGKLHFRCKVDPAEGADGGS